MTSMEFPTYSSAPVPAPSSLRRSIQMHSLVVGSGADEEDLMAQMERRVALRSGCEDPILAEVQYCSHIPPSLTSPILNSTAIPNPPLPCPILSYFIYPFLLILNGILPISCPALPCLTLSCPGLTYIACTQHMEQQAMAALAQELNARLTGDTTEHFSHHSGSGGGSPLRI